MNNHLTNTIVITNKLLTLIKYFAMCFTYRMVLSPVTNL